MKTIEIKNKELLQFIKSSKFHIQEMDRIVMLPTSPERGKMLAQEMNRYNLDLDRFILFECRVPANKMKDILKAGFSL